MKALLVGLGLTVVVFGVTLVVAAIGMYYTNHNLAVDNETSIVAEYDNARNVLSNTTTRVMEMNQIPSNYRDDLMQIIEATFEGRYGENGSQATWQWLQEQNIPLNDALYANVQASIEAGRNEFRNAQQRLIDRRRVYLAQLERDLLFSSGWWMSMAGFPNIDLDKYNIIIEGSVQNRFDNQQDEILNLRGDR